MGPPMGGRAPRGIEFKLSFAVGNGGRITASGFLKFRTHVLLGRAVRRQVRKMFDLPNNLAEKAIFVWIIPRSAPKSDPNDEDLAYIDPNDFGGGLGEESGSRKDENYVLGEIYLVGGDPEAKNLFVEIFRKGMKTFPYLPSGS